MKSIKIIMLFFLLISLLTMGKTYAQENAVIVNKANPNDQLSAVEVKLYYLRKVKRRWPELNKNINPVARKGGVIVKEKFCSDVLNMSNSAVQRHFVERQYQKTEPVPVQVNSDAEVVSYVESNQGGIGYVKLSSLSVGELEKVKVVLKF